MQVGPGTARPVLKTWLHVLVHALHPAGRAKVAKASAPPVGSWLPSSQHRHCPGTPSLHMPQMPQALRLAATNAHLVHRQLGRSSSHLLCALRAPVQPPSAIILASLLDSIKESIKEPIKEGHHVPINCAWPGGSSDEAMLLAVAGSAAQMRKRTSRCDPFGGRG